MRTCVCVCVCLCLYTLCVCVCVCVCVVLAVDMDSACACACACVCMLWIQRVAYTNEGVIHLHLLTPWTASRAYEHTHTDITLIIYILNYNLIILSFFILIYYIH